jgi:hypothetical protein
MSQNQQQGVQVSIDAANKMIERGEALQRLINNPDFAEIIGEAYYKEEPARLAGLLGDIGGSYRWCPENQAMSLPPEQFVKMQKDIQNDLHAVGAFQSFLRVVAWKAESAKLALEELEAAKNAPVETDTNSTEFPEA